MIKNQSELAHYAQVTTARMTHIIWLTNLAPDIQEAILFLPRVESKPNTVKEIYVRRIALDSFDYLIQCACAAAERFCFNTKVLQHSHIEIAKRLVVIAAEG